MIDYTTKAGTVPPNTETRLPSNGRVFFDFYLEETPLTVEGRAIGYRLALLSHNTGEEMEFGGRPTTGCACSLAELGKTLKPSWPNSSDAVIRRKVSEAIKELEARCLIWVLPADRGNGQPTNIYIWQPKDNWILGEIEVATRNVRAGRTLARSSEDLARVPSTGNQPEPSPHNDSRPPSKTARSSQDLAVFDGARSSEDLGLDPRRIAARSSEDHTPYISNSLDLRKKKKEPPQPPKGGSFFGDEDDFELPGTQAETSAPGQARAKSPDKGGKPGREIKVPQALLKKWRDSGKQPEEIYARIELPGKFAELFTRYKAFCADQGVPGREGDKMLAAAAWHLIARGDFRGHGFNGFCQGSGVWKAELGAADSSGVGVPALHIFLWGNQKLGYGPYWLRPLEAEMEPEVDSAAEPEGEVFGEAQASAKGIPAGRLDGEIGRRLSAQSIGGAALLKLLGDRYASHYPQSSYLTVSGLQEAHKRDLLQHLSQEAAA